jgi:hypothetical protein
VIAIVDGQFTLKLDLGAATSSSPETGVSGHSPRATWDLQVMVGLVRKV